MTTAATPAHDLEATTAAARRASGRGPAVAGLPGKLLAADGPALRSAAGVPLVTAPTGATPAQLDAFVAEQRRSAALVG
jgi:hypothetical protein